MPNVKLSPQLRRYTGTKINLPSAYRGKRNSFPFSPHFLIFHTHFNGRVGTKEIVLNMEILILTSFLLSLPTHTLCSVFSLV